MQMRKTTAYEEHQEWSWFSAHKLNKNKSASVKIRFLLNVHRASNPGIKFYAPFKILRNSVKPQKYSNTKSVFFFSQKL